MPQELPDPLRSGLAYRPGPEQQSRPHVPGVVRSRGAGCAALALDHRSRQTRCRPGGHHRLVQPAWMASAEPGPPVAPNGRSAGASYGQGRQPARRSEWRIETRKRNYVMIGYSCDPGIFPMTTGHPGHEQSEEAPVPARAPRPPCSSTTWTTMTTPATASAYAPTAATQRSPSRSRAATSSGTSSTTRCGGPRRP